LIVFIDKVNNEAKGRLAIASEDERMLVESDGI
jgi:hypothetical protein